MEKIKRVSVYLWAVVLVLIDQVVKVCVVNNIKDNSITIIKGILRFSYCENEGVAFSIGDGHVPVFIVVNLLIVCGLIFYFERNRKAFNWFGKIFFIMVIAGGVSNLIDRVFRGFVVDFIDVNGIINFAIFNVADIFIVVGIIGLAFYMIYKSILEEKSKRKEERKDDE